MISIMQDMDTLWALRLHSHVMNVTPEKVPVQQSVKTQATGLNRHQYAKKVMKMETLLISFTLISYFNFCIYCNIICSLSLIISFNKQNESILISVSLDYNPWWKWLGTAKSQHENKKRNITLVVSTFHFQSLACIWPSFLKDFQIISFSRLNI